MIELRDYQKPVVADAVRILKDLHIVYLMCEMRVGKTFMSFMISREAGYKDEEVLFLTKKGGDTKNNIREIQAQADRFGFKCSIGNYESIHKMTKAYKLVIIDEAHNLGTYPKASQRWQKVRIKTKGADIILLSGTATPESWSTIFHQFQLSDWSPFSHYQNFYRWADDYVKKGVKYIGSIKVADYSKADMNKINPVIDPYRLTLTQKEAGFSSEIKETVLNVEMTSMTKDIYKYMTSNGMATFIDSDVCILGDSAAALLTKCHQIASGTVLHGKEMIVIDMSKVMAIKKNADMHGFRKFAIYYKYRAELEIIKKVFDLVTTPEEFQRSEKAVFAAQVISGREGIKLDTAEALYMLNIDFAWVSYEQTKNRIMSLERDTPARLIWVFGDTGLEKQILNKVMKKEKFTAKHFRKGI